MKDTPYRRTLPSRTRVLRTNPFGSHFAMLTNIRGVITSALSACILLGSVGIQSQAEAQSSEPQYFEVGEHTAFTIEPPESSRLSEPMPWVFYAPTFARRLPGPEEGWMIKRFHEQGIAVAGIDVGESYGSPKGRDAYQALYDELTSKRGYAMKPVLLARSRGGLMLYNWAAEHPDSVAAVAGIYPVCNIESYPSVAKAASAYDMTADQLQAKLADHNPINRLEPLAKAKVPILHIHGDQDQVVPLEKNSAALASNYRKLGGPIEVEVIKGQGHNMWDGWFQSQKLTDFIVANALGTTQTQLPDPDDKPADMSKPVQVFLLLGQSNMLGFGKVNPAKGNGEGSLLHAVKEKGRYPYLIDEAGEWTERKDVRNVRVMGSGLGGMRQFNNEWLTIKGQTIGPEVGIGHQLGHAIDAPVMTLKSCIGNRALGWDLLPPGGEGFEFTDSKGVTWVHPGYKGSPERWKKGEEPKKITWYAGMQYDGDISRAKKVLSELDTYYPGATKYEVAGFFWWQGDRDSRSEALSSRYEQNLVLLIKQLRKEFDAPQAKFVCATLGQTAKGAAGNGGIMLDAMMAVDGTSGNYPEFKGNVATVYTHPMANGGSSGGHYGGNAETYMDVGEAMGRAMVKLLQEQPIH